MIQELVEASPGSAPPVVKIDNLSNHFGSVRVLDGVDLTIEPGEVHCLLGHNGSGKSTLIKILCGYHAPDPGAELKINGETAKLPIQPESIRELGFGFVHQDLGLIPTLSVLDNLQLVEAVGERRWWLSRGGQRKSAADMLSEYSVRVDLNADVMTLPPWDRAALAVARAMRELRATAGDRTAAALLVLDEVTAFLPRERKEALYRLIRHVAAQGNGVLFVSHDIEEVLIVGDHITVLRDGRVVGTVRARQTSVDELVQMIVGRRLEATGSAPKRDASPESPILTVAGLSGGAVTNCSLTVGKGEVVGLTGILGSGFEDIPYLLFGSKRATAGEMRVLRRRFDLQRMTTTRALTAGVGLVPADRLGEGMVGALPVVDNVTLPALRHFRRHIGLSRRRMMRVTRQLLKQFGVRPPDPTMQAYDLSGGNQQKALLAKWLQGTPVLLLLHEPTQGVDVGARQDIFRLIREAASRGAAVLIASGDHTQLEALCHRVLVIRSGTVATELTGDSVTKNDIARAAYGAISMTGERDGER